MTALNVQAEGLQMQPWCQYRTTCITDKGCTWHLESYHHPHLQKRKQDELRAKHRAELPEIQGEEYLGEADAKEKAFITPMVKFYAPKLNVTSPR